MKKWIVGLIIMALTGICPFGTYAVANNKSDIHFAKYFTEINLPQYKQDFGEKNQEDDDLKRKKKERQEQERRDQERREQERRDQERREQERRERERREQKHLEWERWENEQRDQRYNRYWYQRNIQREREDCRYIIHRTSETILYAQQAALRGHYTTGLARAIAHQQRARELYDARLYWSAIQHSLRARSLAKNVIIGNREKWVGSKYEYDAREKRYQRYTPKDNDLDIRVDFSSVGSDDAVIRIKFELDINE